MSRRDECWSKNILEQSHYLDGFMSAPDTVYDHPTMGKILLNNTSGGSHRLLPGTRLLVTLRQQGKRAISSYSMVYPNASFIFQDYFIKPSEGGIVFIPFNATVKLHYKLSGKHLCNLNLTKVKIVEFKTFDLLFAPSSLNKHSYDSAKVTKEFSSWMKNMMEQEFFDRLEMAMNNVIPFFDVYCINSLDMVTT